MAVWGAPTAHEDDAERAVRAALELVDAVRALGPGIQARAGVLTGEAAVTIGATNQGMVAGDLVNTASPAPVGRAAGDGPRRRGDAAGGRRGDRVRAGRRADAQGQGRSGPGLAGAPRGRGGRRPQPHETRSRRRSSAATTSSACSRTSSTRRAARGGRGSSRSSARPASARRRLAWEFLKYVDGLVETRLVARRPQPGLRRRDQLLGARRDGPRPVPASLETDDEATTRAKVAETLAAHVPDAEERRWIEPALLALLGIEAGAVGPEQLFGAWRTFFERLAADGPGRHGLRGLPLRRLRACIDFVDHLLEWSRTLPIYVVTLARPELLERRPDWGAGKRNFTSLYLEPLPEPAMRELLAGLVPGLPERAVRAIVARADGDPALRRRDRPDAPRRGPARARGRRLRPVGDLTTLAVPETLTALIAVPPRRPRPPRTARSSPTPPSSARASRWPGWPPCQRARRGRARAAPPSRSSGASSSPSRPTRVSPSAASTRSSRRSSGRSPTTRSRKRDRKVRHLAAARFFESARTPTSSPARWPGHYLAALPERPRGPGGRRPGAPRRGSPSGRPPSGRSPWVLRPGPGVPRAGACRSRRTRSRLGRAPRAGRRAPRWQPAGMKPPRRICERRSRPDVSSAIAGDRRRDRSPRSARPLGRIPNSGGVGAPRACRRRVRRPRDGPGGDRARRAARPGLLLLRRPPPGDRDRRSSPRSRRARRSRRPSSQTRSLPAGRPWPTSGGRSRVSPRSRPAVILPIPWASD